jgi:hypothetical protein
MAKGVESGDGGQANAKENDEPPDGEGRYQDGGRGAKVLHG